jgi:hypothetical protein
MHLQILWSNVNVTGSMLSRQVQAYISYAMCQQPADGVCHDTMMNYTGNYITVRHEGVCKSGGTAPSFLTSALDRGVVSFTPRPPYLWGTKQLGWVALPGPEPRSSSHQHSRYIDWVIAVPNG